MTIQEALIYIGEKLNDEKIIWGLGGSLLLSQYDLAENPRDIDILVAIEDVGRADAILKKLGSKTDFTPSSLYETDYFYEYVINGCDVDLMAGLSIKHEAGIFDYLFDAQCISRLIDMKGISIPLSSLEDWYVLYQMMKNKEAKIKAIEDYLLSADSIRMDLLQRSLSGNLPKEVKARVETLFRNVII